MSDGRDRQLDALLDASAPTITQRTAERDDALHAMVVVARPRRRVRPRAGMAIVGGISLAGLGGVAVAAGLGWTAWWADDAVNEFSYTVPSGVVCTQIIGNFRGDPEAVAAAEDFMAQPDLFQTLDIDQALADVRADTHMRELPDGSNVPAGPGTPYWSEDRALTNAVSHASSTALIRELESRGLETDGFNWEAEQRCSGELDDWRVGPSGSDGASE